MLKRSKIVNLQSYNKKNIDQIQFILQIIDKVEKTNYYQEFYYIYLDSNIYTLEDVAFLVSFSLSTFKRHLKILNLYILAIEDAIKNKKVDVYDYLLI